MRVFWPSRRGFLAGGSAAAALGLGAARGESRVDLGFPGDVGERPLSSEFPQKGSLIVQRTRPPLLETPIEVFDQPSVFTPNDRFYVRWHWDVPAKVDLESFRLTVRGHVRQPQSLSLGDVLAFPPVELAAVNQCAGNSRGFFAPRVAGGEWGNGAMGNARWTGARLSDVLDRAGVKPGALAVRFNGLDDPVVPDGPDFMKSLAIDHAGNGEVLIAYLMNGEPLPLLNGFPLRLVVPGFFATYWVKMLNDIEVLLEGDSNFWMTSAYLIPDRPHADMAPGEAGVKMVPISRLVPRSFITNIKPGASLNAGKGLLARGIAFGGDSGVKAVEFSSDGANTWLRARLGPDEGKYSFRRWEIDFTLPQSGRYALMVRCTNERGEMQPQSANWNPGGYMRNVIERTWVTAS